MIRTIADLESATEEEIEEARKSINLKFIATRQMKKDGKKIGLSYDMWETFLKTRQPLPCTSCDGTGLVMPTVRSVGTIHASQTARCKLRLYYDIIGDFQPEEYIPPELQITFTIGHAVHAVVQAALNTALGDTFRDEVKVDIDDFLIYGSSTDGLWEAPKARVVLEIKTMSEKEFQKLNKPKPDHRLQANGIYATGLDCPFICYLYVSKGWPHSIKQYVEVYDPRLLSQWVREKWRPIEKALMDGVPPIPDATKYECKECCYKRDCPQALVRDKFSR